ncbi:unnamed protein product [marine sediment metagenome]|uniref:Uncharacterized protein n=1 Tax=marine sediment metagenome TaxID=412755 RepID=X1FP03_9ZZZZ
MAVGLYFDGLNNYVDLNNRLFEELPDWTLTAWVYPSGETMRAIYTEGGDISTGQSVSEITITITQQMHLRLLYIIKVLIQEI